MHLKLLSKLRSFCQEKYHSIPISHRQRTITYTKHLHSINSKLKILTYSIPTFSIAALLLLIGNLFCVFSGTPEVFADESDIMPTSTAPVSLTLASNNPSVATTGSTTPGGVAYASSNVKYTATDIKSYSLKISLANGKSNPINSGTTLTGTGTNKTVSTMGNNTWGYSWSDNTNTDETTVTYSTVPTYGSAAQVKSGTTDVNTTGKIMFAAKFADNAPTGHYTTSVLLSLTATPKVLTTYTVTYNCNSGTGCPTNLNTTNYNEAYAYTIPTTEPTRSGYKFLGYSTTNSTTADTNYAPGKAISLTQASPSRTLYAVWQQIIPWASMTTMQQMTPEACAAASIGASKTLTDSRDNSTYTVGKLSDGNCWMTQNLRIVNKTITSADSDVSVNFTIPASSLWTDFAPHVYYNNDTSYGAYYSWYAATAGTGANVTSNNNAAGSICPKGWRLPTGGSDGEFKKLYDKWTTATWTTYNSKNGRWFGGASISAGGGFFPAAGYVDTAKGALSSVGTLGYYWSSTSSSTENAYYLYFYSSYVGASFDWAKHYGHSTRCVAR